jgi:hypothetical protein
LTKIDNENKERIMAKCSKIKIAPVTGKVLAIALCLPLVLAITVASMPHQVAIAQLTPSQQTAIQNLAKTGFTNQQTVTFGGKNYTVPYSIREGQLVGMVASAPTTSLDVIIAPTQYAKSYGVLTLKIPRHLLDSKNPDGTDKAFRLALDGHGLSWKQLSADNTDRTIGLYFGASNGFLQVYGTKIAG